MAGSSDSGPVRKEGQQETRRLTALRLKQAQPAWWLPASLTPSAGVPAVGRQGLRQGLPTEDDKRGRNRGILATAVVALHWGGKGCVGPVGVPVSDKTVGPGA